MLVFLAISASFIISEAGDTGMAHILVISYDIYMMDITGMCSVTNFAEIFG